MTQDYKEIINAIKSYDAQCDVALIKKALEFAIKYHGEQTRESGEPYYHHPLAVAKIIVEMKLDSESVITGLLHDTVEDTILTLEDIQVHFGSNIAKLVDGVTKLSKLEFISDRARQAENFRKLLLAMSEDIRVLMVKLADRLHNMRTIDSVKLHAKRVRVAHETMEIYAPLAERVGMQQVKIELQDICFRILQPEARDSILSRLQVISDNQCNAIDSIVEEFKLILRKEQIEAKVHGRLKTPYSIWLKMQNKNVGLEQLSDIIAFRIIVNDIPLCYKTLGIVHTKYQMVPESFQDFISTPKNNDYRSLHTVIIGPLQQKIEVQIRTNEMHDVAEYGVAAHWRYKQQYTDPYHNQYRWIRELLGILEHAGDPEDFLHNTKLAMYYDQVFCFTPKGHLIALPKGATIVDFAYAVHSDIGHRCIGAKVNGASVKLQSVLNNGDQVEIITGEEKVPLQEWKNFVTTGKAHSEIKRFARSQKREQYISLGKSIIDQVLASAKITEQKSVIEKARVFFKKNELEDLFYSVGDGSVTHEDFTRYANSHRNQFINALSLLKFNYNSDTSHQHSDFEVPINGLICGMAIHMAKCCYPLLGDKIVGLVHIGKGVTVHTADCSMLSNIADTQRLIQLTWDNDKSSIPHICRLSITILNEIGTFGVLCTEIAKAKGNINNFKIVLRSSTIFEVILDLEVADAQHADDIIQMLKAQRVVSQIERRKI